MNSGEDVKLHSGDHVLGKLESMVGENQAIDGVILSQDDVLGHFSKVFPEVLQSNKTGQLTKDSFALWEQSRNEITIGLDTASDATDGKNDVQHDVYIGGPASAVAAALHAKSGQSTDRILYCHDGRREASNWKGSASYFHIRDSVPVYYWPDNHGAYTLYATLKHFYQKNFSYARYAHFLCLGLGAYAYTDKPGY